MAISQEMQDTLDMMAEQRNAAQNAWVQVAAQVKALQRRVAELEAKLAKAGDEPELPLSNGHEERAIQ